jgi:two-component system OmpR family sensor kinase
VNRLFWKFFVASFCALVIAAVGAAFAVSLQLRTADAHHVVTPENLLVEMAASTLRTAGPQALAEWLRDHQSGAGPRLYVLDPRGEELLDRKLSHEQISAARASAASSNTAVHAKLVATRAGEYLLYAPPRPLVPLPVREGPDHKGPFFFPSPWLYVIAGTVASVALSALLAWYMARPIGILRSAFGEAADGRLETRVAPRIGRRRDEIADLGRDFDRMAEQLQQLMAAQQRLLHDVSHELRSPLARLQAAVGLLRQNPGELEVALARIERESARLDGLVGEVLTLARLDSNAIGGSPDTIDLADLVADIVEDARFEAEADGKSVKIGRLDDAVLVGRTQLLERAIENITRNAIKYTNDDTAVEIELSRTPDCDGAVLTICDRGPGLSSTDFERIFEPFFRAAAAAETRGFGLGLAIAKRAIDLHGGKIQAANRPGGGLCVTVELPLAREARVITT